MRKILQILFLSLICTNLFAQENLIPNPGFENTVKCNVSGKPVDKIANWKYIFDGISGGHFPTSDTCSNLLSPVNNNFSQGHTGNQFGYFWTSGYVVHDTMDRGYIFSPLKKTLSANTQYYFEMYVRLEDSDSSGNAISTFATNNQGVKFTSTCFCDNNHFSNGIASASGKSGFENSSKIILAEWTKVSGCFTANGDEKFVTIGNFESDNQTLKQEILKNQGYVYANYRVDDVALYELATKIPNDTAICVGGSIYVDATLKNITANYDWNDNSTQATRYLKNAGIYKLKITPDGACKPIEKQIELKFLPTRADWTAKDTTFCMGDKFVLRAVKDSVGTKLLWSDDSTNPEIAITKSGVYWVRLKNNCIVHTDTINVKSLDCTVKAYIPNAFSPNGDGVNDVFSPFIYAIQPITFYKFDVFDKWGNHVFVSENITDKWDGKYLDHDCDPGIFTWQLQFKVNQSGVDVPYIYSGDVTLVK